MSKMGNVFVQSLGEIWNSLDYEILRAENLSGAFKKYLFCKTCETRRLLEVKEDLSGSTKLHSRKLYVFNKDENK